MGYGDYSPPDDTGRVLSVFFLLIGITIVGGLLNEYASYVIGVIESNAKKAKEIFVEEEIVVNKVPTTTVYQDEDQAKNEAIIKDKAERLAKQWWKLQFGIIALLLCVTMGAVVMKFVMKWSWITAFYWAMVTTMTVGYGDLSIKDDPNVRVFVTFYMLLSTMTVSIALGKIFECFSEWEMEAKKDKIMSNLSLTKILEKFEEQKDSSVDKNEFILFMLQQSMGLDYELDILPLEKKFHELDFDKSGALNRDDVVAFEKKIDAAKRLREEERLRLQQSSLWNKIKIVPFALIGRNGLSNAILPEGEEVTAAAAKEYR